MNNVPIKMCSIFFMDDESILIQGADYETSGPGGVDSSLIARLSRDAGSPLLGVVVLGLLAQTKAVHGANVNTKENTRLRFSMLSGVKSDAAMVKKSKYLHISMTDSLVTIIPSERIKDYWAHLPSLKGTCAAVPDEIMNLVYDRLQECS